VILTLIGRKPHCRAPFGVYVFAGPIDKKSG
jgi:hypothetical protein